MKLIYETPDLNVQSLRSWNVICASEDPVLEDDESPVI